MNQPLETRDAFSNPLFQLGFGSQSPTEFTQYPMTRMTGNYGLLNALYRENWVVQNVVGLMVDDMFRPGYRYRGVSQEQQNALYKAEQKTCLREKLAEGIRWARLYGGAAGLILIKGQEGMLDQPLDLDTLLPGSFAGLHILDRWSGISPGPERVKTLSDPEFNLPEFYNILTADGITAARVHHSRVLRFTGRELPELEKIAEQYWGESEVEALYKDVVAHDNVSANMTALTFQANVSTMEVQNLEQLFALGSAEQQRRFWSLMQAQSVLRSNFGVQLVNKGDQVQTSQYSFSGLQEVYESMCLNLCGASHYPMTRLFGRAPSGMNATGESDLRNYYDYVDTLRASKLRPALEKLLPVLAISVLGEMPDSLELDFPPLWTPNAREMARIVRDKTETVLKAFQAGLIDRGEARGELRRIAQDNGTFGSLQEEP